MRPQKVIVTGVAASPAIPLDFQQRDFKVSLGVTISATATYTVQHTFDDVLSGETPTWFDHSFLTGLSVQADGNLEFPAMATRINVTASTGTVTFYVTQAHT